MVATAAIAVGCGGDNGDGGGGDGVGDVAATAPPLDKAEFDRRAKAACSSSRQQILRNIASYQQENGLLDARDMGVDAVRAIVLPPFQQQVDDLRALGAPPRERQQVEAYLRAKQEALDAIEERGLSSNSDLFRVFERSDRLAQAAGLVAGCIFG